MNIIFIWSKYNNYTITKWVERAKDITCMYSTSRLSVAADHDPTPDTDGGLSRTL